MRYILTLFILLSPSLALADAGFAKGSLWTSRQSITEGDTVTIYSSLANTSEEKVAGSVVFSDDETELGKVALSLEGGESRVVSISWKTKAGNHALRAALVTSDGAELDRTSLSVFVNERPKPAVVAGAATSTEVGDSQNIQKTIADLSPGAGGIINPVLEKLDAARETGVTFLDQKIGGAKASLADIEAKKTVLGEQSGPAVESEKRKLTIRQAFQTLLLYILETLRFILASVAIFYPLLVALFLLALYKIYRHIRRPAYYGSDI